MLKVFKFKHDTPLAIDAAAGLSPGSLIQIHDFHGQDKAYVVSSPCAKISIYKSDSFTLELTSSVRTSTLELFSSSDITILLSSSASPLRVIQLDSPLKNVTLSFSTSSQVGNIVATLSSSATGTGMENVKLEIISSGSGGEKDCFALAETNETTDDVVIDESEDEKVVQWKVSFDAGKGGWQASELVRGDRQYPVL